MKRIIIVVCAMFLLMSGLCSAQRRLLGCPFFRGSRWPGLLGGDRDIAYSPVLKQMAALQNHPEFRFNDDFSKGNIYFSVMHSGFHSFEYINQYIYYALPYFFK